MFKVKVQREVTINVYAPRKDSAEKYRPTPHQITIEATADSVEALPTVYAQCIEGFDQGEKKRWDRIKKRSATASDDY